MLRIRLEPFAFWWTHADCHPREKRGSREPPQAFALDFWMPAFAGMTSGLRRGCVHQNAEGAREGGAKRRMNAIRFMPAVRGT